MLGRNDILTKVEGVTLGEINLNLLKETFEKPGEDATDEVINHHVRAYVLFLIGCFVCPLKDTQASTLFLNNLENVKEIGSYAWGAALLSYLNRGMQLLRARRKKDVLRGNGLILQVSICVR